MRHPFTFIPACHDQEKTFTGIHHLDRIDSRTIYTFMYTWKWNINDETVSNFQIFQGVFCMDKGG